MKIGYYLRIALHCYSTAIPLTFPRSEVMILGEMCVLSVIYNYVAVCSVQYVVSLLFASICYFIIIRLTFF
jgi:hypothetical protein